MSPRTSTMTAAQRRVFDFIADFVRENGYPPTRREISAGLGFASVNSAQDHVAALVRLGALWTPGGGARRIAINDAWRPAA